MNQTDSNQILSKYDQNTLVNLTKGKIVDAKNHPHLYQTIKFRDHNASYLYEVEFDCYFIYVHVTDFDIQYTHTTNQEYQIDLYKSKTNSISSLKAMYDKKFIKVDVLGKITECDIDSSSDCQFKTFFSEKYCIKHNKSTFDINDLHTVVNEELPLSELRKMGIVRIEINDSSNFVNIDNEQRKQILLSLYNKKMKYDKVQADIASINEKITQLKTAINAITDHDNNYVIDLLNKDIEIQKNKGTQMASTINDINISTINNKLFLLGHMIIKDEEENHLKLIESSEKSKEKFIEKQKLELEKYIAEQNKNVIGPSIEQLKIVRLCTQIIS